MRGLVLCGVLLAVGCKGSKSGGDSPGGRSATAPPAPAAKVSRDAAAAPASVDAGAAAAAPVAEAGVIRPKELAELEAALRALLAEPDSDARSRKTCGQFKALHGMARAVALNRPEGVDPAAWDAANDEIASSFDGLVPYCQDDPPDDSLELPKLYKNVQNLVSLLPAGWELRSAPIELECSPPPPTGSYQAALDAGRAAGKAKRWAEAVAALDRAIAVKPGDGVAVGELAWATLHVGDAQRALLLSERAIAMASGPNAQAASHYNAARAAETLGDLPLARSHYEKSLALRPNDAIRDRLAKLAPVPPRPLPRGTPLTACQKLASVDAACQCLATSVAKWGSAAGLEGAASCEPAEQRGTQAQLVVVRAQPADPDAAAGGTALVLLARRGDRWSALQVVDTADDIDLTETPQAVHAATVLAYEERAEAGGTAIWVQTQNQYSESGAGEREVRGEAGLTVCSVPTAASAPASCSARIPIAGWDHSAPLTDDDDGCQVRTRFAYRAALTSAGTLTLVLEAGTDDSGRSGRYQR